MRLISLCCLVLFSMSSKTAASETSSYQTKVQKDAVNDLKAEGSGADYVKPYGGVQSPLAVLGQQLFSPLGLTPQQSQGVISILLTSGLLEPNLSIPGHLPYFNVPNPRVNFGFGFPNHSNLLLNQGGYGQPDPYLLLLLSHYGKYLPYGVGSYGIFGTNNLAQTKPPGIFKHSKN